MLFRSHAGAQTLSVQNPSVQPTNDASVLNAMRTQIDPNIVGLDNVDATAENMSGLANEAQEMADTLGISVDQFFEMLRSFISGK